MVKSEAGYLVLMRLHPKLALLLDVVTGCILGRLDNCLTGIIVGTVCSCAVDGRCIRALALLRFLEPS